MGCVCCSLSSFVSILLDALERVSLCTVCAMLTCCLTVTLLTVMIMGIGIGFHYCFVQNSVDAMEKAAQAVGALRSGPAKPPSSGHVLRSLDRAVQRGLTHRVARREADAPPEFNKKIVFSKLFGHNSTSIDYPIASKIDDISNITFLTTITNLNASFPILT